MLGFIKKCFFYSNDYFWLQCIKCKFFKICVTMNNLECKIRSEIVNVNSGKPLFYPDSVKTNKFKGSCNSIDNPYANS